MKTKIIGLFIIFILIIFSFTSCHTERKIIKEPIKEKNEGAEYLFKKLKENELVYNDLSIKFEAELSFDKNKNTFKGLIKIKKDSIMWISIFPLLGIEAFRVVLTNDSVKMINKLNNTYFKGDYTLINAMFNTPFDFDMLQSMITGNDFSYYENDIFKVGIDQMQYKLTTIGRRKLKKYIKNQLDNDKVLMQDIWLDTETFKIVKQQWKEIKKENSKLMIYYSDFSKIENEGQMFPNTLICDITAENNILLNLKYSKVQINSDFKYPFSIPDKYNSIK